MLPFAEVKHDGLKMLFFFIQINYRIEFTVIVCENAWDDVTLSKFGESVKNEFQNSGRY